MIGAGPVTLEALTADLARSILSGPRRDDWAADFPSPGDEIAARRIDLDGAQDRRRAPFLLYVVREAGSGLLVGGCGFHSNPIERVVEIGYGLAASARGRGLATAAVRALARVALDSGEADVVVATCDASNVPSQRVLARAGFAAVNDRATLWVSRGPRPATPSEAGA